MKALWVGGMNMEVNRQSDLDIWKPTLSGVGFTDLLPATEADDFQGIDAYGIYKEERYGLALRQRNRLIKGYEKYVKEISIRSRTEFKTVFGKKEVKPDFMCYGWLYKTTLDLDPYLILDVHCLRALYIHGELFFSQRENTDGKTVGTYIPISGLRSAVLWHSPNHPGMV